MPAKNRTVPPLSMRHTWGVCGLHPCSCCLKGAIHVLSLISLFGYVLHISCGQWCYLYHPVWLALWLVGDRKSKPRQLDDTVYKLLEEWVRSNGGYLESLGIRYLDGNGMYQTSNYLASRLLSDLTNIGPVSKGNMEQSFLCVP